MTETEKHINFSCLHCGQNGEIVWSENGKRELLRLSDGFHVEEGRLLGEKCVIICNACDEIDAPGILK